MIHVFFLRKLSHLILQFMTQFEVGIHRSLKYSFDMHSLYKYYAGLLSLITLLSCTSVHEIEITRAWLEVDNNNADKKHKIMPLHISDEQLSNLQDALYHIRKETQYLVDNEIDIILSDLKLIPAYLVIEHKKNGVYALKYFPIKSDPPFHISNNKKLLKYGDISTFLTYEQKKELSGLKVIKWTSR